MEVVDVIVGFLGVRFVGMTEECFAEQVFCHCLGKVVNDAWFERVYGAVGVLGHVVDEACREGKGAEEDWEDFHCRSSFVDVEEGDRFRILITDQNGFIIVVTKEVVVV